MGYLLSVMALIGVWASINADGCSKATYWPNLEDTKLFGAVRWSVLGACGYGLIAVSFEYPMLQNSLIVNSALVNVWLICEARRLGDTCPFCRISWVITGILFVGVLVRLSGFAS